MLLKGLWDMIVDFFNLIPKSIYFLYATLASAVDAMQALIRKLAGLDVYYQVIQGQEKGTAVAMRDPLTEFVYERECVDHKSFDRSHQAFSSYSG